MTDFVFFILPQFGKGFVVTVGNENGVVTKSGGSALFMNDFTDNDGIFTSFNQLDRNNWIFQLNFSIA